MSNWAPEILALSRAHDRLERHVVVLHIVGCIQTAALVVLTLKVWG